MLINFSLTFAYKEGNVKEMFEEYLKLSGRKNPLYIAGSLDDKSLLQKEVFERPDIDPEAHANLPELLAELRNIDAFDSLLLMGCSEALVNLLRSLISSKLFTKTLGMASFDCYLRAGGKYCVRFKMIHDLLRRPKPEHWTQK